jgi:hypothetical protein
MGWAVSPPIWRQEPSDRCGKDWRWMPGRSYDTPCSSIPPLLPFNLEPDEHFRLALQRAQQPLPHEDIPVTDMDLQFLASGYS